MNKIEEIKAAKDGLDVLEDLRRYARERIAYWLAAHPPALPRLAGVGAEAGEPAKGGD